MNTFCCRVPEASTRQVLTITHSVLQSKGTSSFLMVDLVPVNCTFVFDVIKALDKQGKKHFRGSTHKKTKLGVGVTETTMII